MNRTWPRLGSQVPIKVVYPCVDVDAAAREDAEVKASAGRGKELLGGDRIILSINRFERKKDIGLAIKAFAAIPVADRKNVRLVLAGMCPSRAPSRALLCRLPCPTAFS